MTKSREISEHTLELRFKNQAAFFDCRGLWIAELSKKLDLGRWRLGDQHIECEDQKAVKAFVSYSRAGLTIRDSQDPVLAIKRMNAFVESLLDLHRMADPLHVQRIGCRSKFLAPSDGKFKALMSRFSDRYYQLTPEAQSALGGELVDNGVHLNLRDELGQYNTACGPMKQTQTKQLFRNHGEVPPLGLFFDIDYFKTPDDGMARGAITTFARKCVHASWLRFAAIRALVLDE